VSSGETIKQKIKERWNNFVQGTKRNNEVVVALSTFVMAVFTVALFIATRALWKSGERHSERSLRAYVFPTEIKVENVKTSTPVVAFVEVKNSGQTPAYNFICQAKMTAGEFPQTDFSVSEEAGLPVAYLGPGNSTWFTPRGDRVLTGEQAEQITQGTAAIYVFGEIHY